MVGYDRYDGDDDTLGQMKELIVGSIVLMIGYSLFKWFNTPSGKGATAVEKTTGTMLSVWFQNPITFILGIFLIAYLCYKYQDIKKNGWNAFKMAKGNEEEKAIAASKEILQRIAELPENRDGIDGEIAEHNGSVIATIKGVEDLGNTFNEIEDEIQKLGFDDKDIKAIKKDPQLLEMLANGDDNIATYKVNDKITADLLLKLTEKLKGDDSEKLKEAFQKLHEASQGVIDNKMTGSAKVFAGAMPAKQVNLQEIASKLPEAEQRTLGRILSKLSLAKSKAGSKLLSKLRWGDTPLSSLSRDQFLKLKNMPKAFKEAVVGTAVKSTGSIKNIGRMIKNTTIRPSIRVGGGEPHFHAPA